MSCQIRPWIYREYNLYVSISLEIWTWAPATLNLRDPKCIGITWTVFPDQFKFCILRVPMAQTHAEILHITSPWASLYLAWNGVFYLNTTFLERARNVLCSLTLKLALNHSNLEVEFMLQVFSHSTILRKNCWRKWPLVKILPLPLSILQKSRSSSYIQFLKWLHKFHVSSIQYFL